MQYWAAEVSQEAVLASTFTPNKEIEALEWVPVKRAAKRLSYGRDRKILAVLADLAEKDVLRTFPVIMLRHCQAVPKTGMVDHERPLSEKGVGQAGMLPPMLAPFGPQRVFTSDAVRCVETVTPTAEALEITLKRRSGLSQDTFNSGDLSELRRIIGKVVTKARPTIVCSHRPVLPEISRELTLATGSIPGLYNREAAELPVGGFSVFHIPRERPGAGIVAVETYPLTLRP